MATDAPKPPSSFSSSPSAGGLEDSKAATCGDGDSLFGDGCAHSVGRRFRRGKAGPRGMRDANKTREMDKWTGDGERNIKGGMCGEKSVRHGQKQKKGRGTFVRVFPALGAKVAGCCLAYCRRNKLGKSASMRLHMATTGQCASSSKCERLQTTDKTET